MIFRTFLKNILNFFIYHMQINTNVIFIIYYIYYYFIIFIIINIFYLNAFINTIIKFN